MHVARPAGRQALPGASNHSAVDAAHLVKVRVRVWVGAWVGVKVRVRVEATVKVRVRVRIRGRARVRVGSPPRTGRRRSAGERARA